MIPKFIKVRDIIDDYVQNHLGGIQKELRSCNNPHDFVYGKPLNKHQQRWNGQFDDVVDALEQVNFHIQDFESYEDLYDAVKKIYEANGHSNAILAIYDTTLRIGYNHSPQILPEQYVYLYGTNKTGPLGGATRLYGQAWIDKHFDKINHRIETKWFAKEFPDLPSWEIESILCIYADCFTYQMPY